MAWLQRLPKRLTLRFLPNASGSSEATPQATLAAVPSHSGNSGSNGSITEGVHHCQAHDARLVREESIGDGERATTTSFISNGDRSTSDTCFMTENCNEISWQDLHSSLVRQPPHSGVTARPRQRFEQLRRESGHVDMDTVGFYPKEQPHAMDAQPRADLRKRPAALASLVPAESFACHDRESKSLTALNGPRTPVTPPIFELSDACTVGETPLPVAARISKRRVEASGGEARQLRARRDGSRDAHTLKPNASQRAASNGEPGAVSIDLTMVCESQLDCQITSSDNLQTQLGDHPSVEASALPSSSSCRQANQAVAVSERNATSSSSSSAAPVTVVAIELNEGGIFQETVQAAATTRRCAEPEGSSRRLQPGAEVIESLNYVDDLAVSGDGFSNRPRATLQPSHQRPSMMSDLEIAMALQLEEGAIGDTSTHERRRTTLSEPRMCLYFIEPSRSTVRCFACREPIQRGTPRVLFMRSGRRHPNSVHTLCVTATPGLVQPQPSPLGEVGDGGSAFFDSRLSEDDRVNVASVLEQLPQAPNTAVQPFMWPLPQRPPSRRSELRAQLLQSDRDFTADDYELLLELDNRGGSGGSRASKEETDFKSALLAHLPVTKLLNSVVDTQCSICLDVMESGSEVRTLPCMHRFHRHCIDRWLMTPGPPRCPVDQVEVQL